MQKNILIVSNSAFIVQRFRKELINSLTGLDNQVFVCFPFDDPINDKYSSDLLKEIGCKLIDTKMSRRTINLSGDIKLIKCYVELIDAVHPDVVLTYTIKPNIYCGLVCRLKNVKYIASITGLGSGFEKNFFLRSFIVFLYRTALKKAKCIFFQNGYNQKFFYQKKIIKKQNVKLVQGSGVNIKRFVPLKYPDDNIIKFVTIIRILKEKGIDEYLEAAAFFKKKYKNVEFHLCGIFEENYKDTIEYYRGKEIIKYHGLVEDIRQVLSVTHCTILASYHEGMSNILLESAACARPVIATNISGCREIVEDAKTGFLINPKDSKSLIDSIEKFLLLDNKDRKEMGLLGRQKIVKEFDRNSVVAAYIDEILN